MHITASKIRQNSSILQKALKEDIIVTKRNEPYVVIIDYDKYIEISDLAERYRKESASRDIANKWLKSAKESESHYSKDDLEHKKELQGEYKKSLENI